MSKYSFRVLLALVSIVSCGLTMAETGSYEVGFRFDGNLADGEPANDMLGGSILGRYRINSEWLAGAAIEFTSGYDVEEPNEWLNISSTEVVDASADTTMFSAWIERRYNEKSRGGYWFWTAGLGVNDVDVDDARGMTLEGEDYQIKTDVDTEFVVFATAGRRHNITENWSLDYGVRLARHFGDWTVKDYESGTTKTHLDGYTVHGGFFTANYRF